MTGHAPNTGRNATTTAPISVKTGYTPGPTAMSVDSNMIRIGRKFIVPAGIGKKAIVMAANGAKAIVMAGTGAKAIVMAATGAEAIVMAGTGARATAMAGTGRGIITLAITPGAMRHIRVITGMAGTTTGTHRTTA